MAVAATTAVRLDKISQGENQVAQKGVAITALFAATDSAPTLATTFAKISSRFCVGNNPGSAIKLAWTKASGTILTVRIKTSLDDGTSDPYEYVPSVGSPTTGTSAVDILELTFASATWVYTGSPSATIAYLPIDLQLPRWRYFEIWAKSDNASGTVSGYVVAGAGS